MLQPQKTEELAALVADAAAHGRKLQITGGGTRGEVGAPSRVGDLLSMTAMSGIVSYDPAELVLTAKAGTPLAELQAALAEQGQAFSFEPQGAPGSTIGGVIGAGFSGSRRVSAGAVRDHLLGFEAVSGRGERFKAGGKVVKNVTGYDLSKLMCGSWGRLAALTEVTLKVLPRPAERRTLVWTGLDDARAWAIMGEALRLPADVAAAAHSPGMSHTLIRIEGFGPSVEARATLLKSALERFGTAAAVGGEEGDALWRPFASATLLDAEATLWRFSVPRRAGLDVVRALAGSGRWIADWAGGLIYHTTDADASLVRGVTAEAGGHATLLRANTETRAQVPAFHPQSPALAALTARVRRAFDPLGVFETGRFLDEAHAD